MLHMNLKIRKIVELHKIEYNFLFNVYSFSAIFEENQKKVPFGENLCYNKKKSDYSFFTEDVQRYETI